MGHIHRRTCCLCEASCGLTIEVEGTQILAIRGDEEDPLSRGHICPKAVALKDLHEDPDRLRRPMRRVGDRWEEIGWDEALDEAAARFAQIRAAHGPHALGTYLGNPAVHNYGALLAYIMLAPALRTHNRFSATSVDQLPRMLVSLLLYGHQALLPVPDVDRTAFFLVIGANPVASNGSIMTAPDMPRRLKDLKARGGQLVVVDPRRTETAELATRHLPIRPGTDALLLLGMLHVILGEGLSVPGRLGPMMTGWETVERLAEPWTPERVAPPTGIDAQDIRALARGFAAAPSAVAYGRIGACTQRFGALTTWLCDLLNLATGNLDRAGGAMFTTPAFDLVELAARSGQRGHFDRGRSRVRGLPEFGGELPVITLAEEIETPGDKQIRALLTLAGNPVLSTPDGSRLGRALRGLDFMVSIDPWLNETTRHAHLILPPVSPLERDHYDAALLMLAVRNTARYSEPLFEPPPDSRHDWQILSELATRLALKEGSIASRLKARARHAALSRLRPAGILDLALRAGPWGDRFNPFAREGLSLARLKAEPAGVDLGPLTPRLPEALRYGGGRLDAAPERLVKDLDRLAAALPSLAPAPGELRLIGRRHLLDNNSWMHNAPRLVKGKDRCTLLIHPEDAAARGLSAGDVAVVRSRVGEVRVPVQVSDAMMPGVVSLPHGYGHGREGTRLSVASAHAGVSLNDLTDPTVFDELSGTAALSGIAVEVGAAG